MPSATDVTTEDARTRATRIGRWLVGTWAGRLVGIGVVVKLAAFVAALGLGPSSAGEAIDTLGDLALVGGTVVLASQFFGRLRQQLLWRVRRKLILSYVFIGVVPVLLVVVFFTVGGLLFFLNVSAFMLRSHVDALVDVAHSLADGAAGGLSGVTDAASATAAIGLRQAATHARYEQISYALVPTERACGGGARVPVAGVAGPWAHALAPATVPAWVPCDGVAMLIAYRDEAGTGIAARAVAFPDGLNSALVVDIPFGEAQARTLHDEMGLTVREMLALNAVGGASAPAAAPRGEPVPGTAGSAGRVRATARSADDPLGWVAFVDYTDWPTGETSALTVGFGVGPAVVYRYLSGPSFDGLGDFSFGQVLLVLLGVVGGLFLVIQSVAFLMGLALARSITGSVHELFTGTERVRQGDFSHKIAIQSRDQLGELATSFNSMTASIEDLLYAKAEKERLEQELRVARSIQMSLLPQAALRLPGLRLSGHCEPAREVGGDYYDFLPLADGRIGILIADVAGKGTSAALYMAELKGLVLALSQQHASPRQLLVDANRIISRHLDARSFITMTYAVMDPSAGTLTFARAGHCPLIHVPGSHASVRTPRALVPDGMVLGLQLDTGDTFDRLLEEVTLPVGPGDVVLFYTDGISEAMNVAGDCFGDERLLALTGQHADLSSDELRERILREVHAFVDGEAQHDDMTMVILKVGDA